MKNLVYLLVFVMALQMSCNNGKRKVQEQAEIDNKVQNQTVIDLSGALKTDTVMMLSSIADNIEYVPLETTPECLLGNYWNVRATVLKDYIVVSDKNQRNDVPLKLFSRQGKYLGEIGGIGKGPQEYVNILGYSCLEGADRIYILNRYPAKLLVFNFDRKFLGTIPVAERAAKVLAEEPDRLGIMYLPHNEMMNDSARFEWIDHSGKILSSVPLYSGRPKGGGGMHALSASLRKIGDELHFLEHPFDTVYRLDPDKGFRPIGSFMLGPEQMPREFMLNTSKFDENFKNYSFINRAFETPESFFINVISKQMNKTVYYAKKDHKAYWLRKNDGFAGFFLGTQGFINDLDGGAPFWPNSSSNDHLVSVTSPEVLKPAFKDKPAANVKLKRPDHREKLFKMVDQLKEDDNPIVVIVTTR
jgi:hypothetical protein